MSYSYNFFKLENNSPLRTYTCLHLNTRYVSMTNFLAPEKN